MLRRVMHDAKTYRQYAADCRRIAASMTSQDRDVLLRMAEVWDERAEEATKKVQPDGQGKGDVALP
jgi:hypothetical protein